MQNSASQMHLATAPTPPQLDSYAATTLLSLTYILSQRIPQKPFPINSILWRIPQQENVTRKKTVPHLIVKRGENHVGALTEILSTLLDEDKQQFSLDDFSFQNWKQKRSMQFSKHTDFVTNIQSLSLCCCWKPGQSAKRRRNRMRTAQAWAKTFADADG